MTGFPTAPETPSLNPSFWEQRYQEGSTRWDLGRSAPAFQHLLASPDAPFPGKMLVLGCGRGHDALLFARAGFRVTGVDYAPSAIAAATQAASAQGLQVEFLQQDIFDLPPAHAEQFDYVVEHTCYCAIDPALRDRYVDLVVQLLKPGGRLIALFFTHNRPGGPPYGATKAEIATRFGRQFECEHLELNPHSVESRRQEEHLGIFQKPQA